MKHPCPSLTKVVLVLAMRRFRRGDDALSAAHLADMAAVRPSYIRARLPVWCARGVLIQHRHPGEVVRVSYSLGPAGDDWYRSLRPNYCARVERGLRVVHASLDWLSKERAARWAERCKPAVAAAPVRRPTLKRRRRPGARKLNRILESYYELLKTGQRTKAEAKLALLKRLAPKYGFEVNEREANT